MVRKARQGSTAPNSGEVPALTPEAERFPVVRVHQEFTTPAAPADVARGYAVVGERKQHSKSTKPTPGHRTVWTEPHEPMPGKGKPFGG